MQLCPIGLICYALPTKLEDHEEPRWKLFSIFLFTKEKETNDYIFGQTSCANKTSIKDQVQCPFMIRFSIPGIKNKKRPTIFYEVRITQVNPSHTCLLSPLSFRVDKRSSTSTKKIELNALNIVVKCLKLDPHLSAIHLRPLLAPCLPLDTNLSCDFIKNFRRRYQLYMAKHYDESDDINLSTGNKLLSSSSITDDELQFTDDPKVLANFRSMYSRIMQNGSELWKALALLKELRRRLTGFDFRIRLGEDNVPTGLVWITYHMRKHLLQYGDILFLDTQKRQYNKLC